MSDNAYQVLVDLNDLLIERGLLLPPDESERGLDEEPRLGKIKEALGRLAAPAVRIEVEGGLVQDVFTSYKGIGINVVDRDNAENGGCPFCGQDFGDDDKVTTDDDGNDIHTKCLAKSKKLAKKTPIHAY